MGGCIPSDIRGPRWVGYNKESLDNSLVPLEVPKPVPDGTNGSSLSTIRYGLNEDILIELKNFSCSVACFRLASCLVTHLLNYLRNVKMRQLVLILIRLLQTFVLSDNKKRLL